MKLLTLTATFSTQDEDTPSVEDVLWALETKIRQLEGTAGCAADLLRRERKFEVIVEVEGEVDVSELEVAANEALIEAVPRFSEDPIWGEMTIDEVSE